MGEINEYACADAANIRYTIGEMPTDERERQACIEVLQQFQNPETGMFKEPTHVMLHGTAHCLSALELYDAKPLYPLKGLDSYRTPKGMIEFLEGLDWVELKASGHMGAGAFAALTVSRGVTEELREAYFTWLDKQVDSTYGIGQEGAIDAGARPIWHHLGDWFHFLFNYSFMRWPFPNVEKLIDTCIDMYQNNRMNDKFGQICHFMEIDWIYTLNRSVMQSGYRFQESREILKDFAKMYIENMAVLDKNTDPTWNDLHLLFGMTCALSELQLALPGEIVTKYPLRQVLDRRPFI